MLTGIFKFNEIWNIKGVKVALSFFQDSKSRASQTREGEEP